MDAIRIVSDKFLKFSNESILNSKSFKTVHEFADVHKLCQSLFKCFLGVGVGTWRLTKTWVLSLVCHVGFVNICL